MEFSARNTEASAATIESAQTGHVGKSRSRGAGRRDTLRGSISATAGIVPSWLKFELLKSAVGVDLEKVMVEKVDLEFKATIFQISC
jgi:hypothetical protein